MRGWKARSEGPRSEVRGQRSEVRSQEPEVRAGFHKKAHPVHLRIGPACESNHLSSETCRPIRDNMSVILTADCTDLTDTELKC